MINKLQNVAGREMLRKKGIIRRLYDRIMHFIQWVLDQLKDKLNLAVFVVVLIVMYSPCWLCLIIYSISENAAFFAVAMGYMAFWAGPFTPFFPMCIAITIAIRKVIGKIINRDKL